MGNPQKQHQNSKHSTKGQRRLTNTPICIEPMDPKEKLDPESRLNYAKPHAVEHNLKVFFIGKVHKDSIAVFQATYDRIQNETNLPERPVVGTVIDEGDEQAQDDENNVHPHNRGFRY